MSRNRPSKTAKPTGGWTSVIWQGTDDGRLVKDVADRLAAGCGPNGRDRWFIAPLVSAAGTAHPDAATVVGMLLDAGAHAVPGGPIETGLRVMPQRDRHLPLAVAAAKCADPAVVERLAADPTTTPALATIALRAACTCARMRRMEAHARIVDALLAAGADIRAPAERGTGSGLLEMALRGSGDVDGLGMAAALVAAGARPSCHGPHHMIRRERWRDVVADMETRYQTAPASPIIPVLLWFEDAFHDPPSVSDDRRRWVEPDPLGPPPMDDAIKAIVAGWVGDHMDMPGAMRLLATIGSDP